MLDIDLFGGKNASQQLLYELQLKRKHRPYISMLSGPGELFAGSRPQQLDVESAVQPPGLPTAVAYEVGNGLLCEVRCVRYNQRRRKRYGLPNPAQLELF